MVKGADRALGGCRSSIDLLQDRSLSNAPSSPLSRPSKSNLEHERTHVRTHRHRHTRGRSVSSPSGEPPQVSRTRSKGRGEAELDGDTSSWRGEPPRRTGLEQAGSYQRDLRRRGADGGQFLRSPPARQPQECPTPTQRELAVFLHSQPWARHLRDSAAPQRLCPVEGALDNGPTACLASWQTAAANCLLVPWAAQLALGWTVQNGSKWGSRQARGGTSFVFRRPQSPHPSTEF